MRWTANDTDAVVMLVVIAVEIVVYDVTVIVTRGGGATLSEAVYRWCGMWPWLTWVLAGGLFLLFWHLAYRFWPFGGE